MNKFGFATIAATALTAGFLGLAAPAIAAPTGGGNAEETITNLEGRGYRVVVNRLSTAPLDEANVVSIGEGASFTHNENISGTEDYTGQDREYEPVTVRTMYVNVR